MTPDPESRMQGEMEFIISRQKPITRSPDLANRIGSYVFRDHN